MTRLHTGTIPTSTLAATARVVDGFVSMQAARQGSVKNDTFTHNDRSELTAATLGTDAYNYSYDNIGNRKTAQEAAEEATAYDANNLNQYTSIQEGTAEAFIPTFDADGNQTKVKTSTGIWDVSYNILNRPTSFVRTNADGTQTKITAAYDTHGRRVWKKVEEISADGTTATVTSHRLFLYRGYLQIASLDLTRPTLPAEHFILWDPTEEVATRPLAIQKNGTWYTYGRDLTKNICEVFGSDGYIKTAYTYTSYGAVTASGNVTQPIQWSSEYNDSELGLVYYNYRHYNPADGRWLGRDCLDYIDCYNLYTYCSNNIFISDHLGLGIVGWFVKRVGSKLIRRKPIYKKSVMRKAIEKNVDVESAEGRRIARQLSRSISYRKKGMKLSHHIAPKAKPGYRNHFHTSNKNEHGHVFYSCTTIILDNVSNAQNISKECEFVIDIQELSLPPDSSSNPFRDLTLKEVMEDKEKGAMLDLLNPFSDLTDIKDFIDGIEGPTILGYRISIHSRKNNTFLFSVPLDLNGSLLAGDYIVIDYLACLNAYEKEYGKFSADTEWAEALEKVTKYISTRSGLK